MFDQRCCIASDLDSNDEDHLARPAVLLWNGKVSFTHLSIIFLTKASALYEFNLLRIDTCDIKTYKFLVGIIRTLKKKNKKLTSFNKQEMMIIMNFEIIFSYLS